MSKNDTNKGGRKGGTMFPRIRLKEAASFAKKLVSKTHTGPQPDTVILPGVFGSSSDGGKVRASALKQFGLLKGTPKAYDATDLAKEIVAAPDEEISSHFRKAFFNAKLFKTLFDTFRDDTVSTARVRQQALQLKVHPDNVVECITVFIHSAIDSSLATQSGDNVTFCQVAAELHSGNTDGEADESEEESDDSDENPEPAGELTKKGADRGTAKLDEQNHPREFESKTKANLEIKIDPSMDPEKLDKLLGVLKKYGQI